MITTSPEHLSAPSVAWSSRVGDLETAVFLLSAARALLRVTTVEEVVDTCRDFASALGGSALPARLAPAAALPIDIAFGTGEPLLWIPPQDPAARLRFETVAAELAEDARAAVTLIRHTERLTTHATQDRLTGLLNRRSVDRLLPRLTSADVVVMIDLDHFKAVNDTLGHAAGDIVLAAFARVLLDRVRITEWCGRVGGEEFVVVMRDTDVAAALLLVDRIRASWRDVRPHPITFSAGVANVGAGGGVAALALADAALYDAKAAGRNCTHVSGRSGL